MMVIYRQERALSAPGIQLADKDHKQVNILFNILKESFMFRMEMFLLGTIMLALLLLELLRSVHGLLTYKYVNALQIPAITLLLSSILRVTELLVWLATAFTTSSTIHRQVYEDARLGLFQGQLKVKSWAKLTFFVANILKVDNQLSLTILNDYVMNLFFTLLLGL